MKRVWRPDNETTDSALTMLSVLTCLATMGAIIFILLSAYPRLSCVNLSACYRHLMVLPDHYFISTKMIYAYFSGGLSLLVCFIALLSAFVAVKRGVSFLAMGIWLLLLVAYQMILSISALTFHLTPWIVLQHFLTSIVLLVLLWCLHLKASPRWRQITVEKLKPFTPWVIFALILITTQMLIDAWASFQYAPLNCEAFSFCRAVGWVRHAFHLSPLYSLSAVDETQTQTISLVHRLGVLILFSYLIVLSAFILMKIKKAFLIRTMARLILLVVFLQVMLGVLMALLKQTVMLSILHSLGIVLLLMLLITLNYLVLTCPLGVNKCKPKLLS